MTKDEKKYALLKGIGKYYGHVIKVELLEVDYEINFEAKVKTSEGELWFSVVTGFQSGIGKETGFSTYQLDIDSIKDNQFSHRKYLNNLREI